MTAACAKIPIRSISNDRHIGVLPAEQSPAASRLITAPPANVTCLSYAVKAAAHAYRLIDLVRHSPLQFFAQLVLRPGDDSNVPIC
jgi:hypothetical protein